MIDHTGVGVAAGFGEAPKPDFWIHGGGPNKPPIHVAFRVNSRAPDSGQVTQLPQRH